METQAQLQDVESQLAQLDPNNRDNLVKIAELKAKQVELQNQLEQEQAAQVRIQDATEQAAYFLDNLVIEGLTMRQLCNGEAEYQMLRIAVQDKLISLAEDNSKQIQEVQAEESAQKNQLKQELAQLQAKFDEENRQAYEDSQTIMQLQAQLSQAKLEVEDYQTKLKNATDEIDRLNSQVDDLRKEIAVGARNAYKVQDIDKSEQLKQLAEQIKASRVKVYDVQAVDLNRSKFTAKLAATGEPISYGYLESGKYVEVSAAEAEQFRNEQSQANPVQDTSLDQPVQDSPVVPEVPFPEIPQAQAPGGDVSGEVQVVDSASENAGTGGQTIEERVAALEAHVFGFVKQAS